MKLIITSLVIILLLLSTSIISGQEDELQLYNIWQTPDNIEVSHLIISDLNNDNLDEMIYSFIENGTHQFLCVRNITNQTIIWQIELSIGAQHGIQNLQVTDIDNDSMQEIIVINDDFMIQFYTGINGTLEGSIDGVVSGVMAINDVDSDNEIEIIIPRWSSNNSLQIMGDSLVIYDGKTLNIEWESQIIESGAVIQQLQVDDVDLDGVKEILVVTSEHNLTIYNGINKNVEFITTTNSSSILVVDDLNHDGYKEIITNSWDWPVNEALPLQKLLIYNGTDYNLLGTTCPMYNFGFLDLDLFDVNGDNITDIFVTASDGLKDTIFIFNGIDYSLMSQWECNCDVTSISTGNLNEDNNTEIIIGTDQSNWVNGTRGVQGYIHVIDSTTFTNKWVSSNIGIVHEIFIPDLSAQTNMVVFSGDTITIFSTSDIPQENNSSNETPGFEISTIILAFCIVLIISKNTIRKTNP